MPEQNLVLLPGLLCDHASWGRVPAGVEDLVEISFARYGMADSFSAMAEKVLQDAPDQFAVAGHSMGGRVALQLVQMAPERITGLALFGTSAEGVRPDSGPEAARRQQQLSTAERLGLRGFCEALWLDNLVAPASRQDAQLVATILAMMDRQSVAQMRVQIAAALTRSDMTDVLTAIRCPALVLAGELDATRPPAVHRAMAERIPAAALTLVPGAGHMVMMEAPDPVIAAMRDWLQQVGESTSTGFASGRDM